MIQEMTIGEYESYENRCQYEQGVVDALGPLTFEEAVTCGFENPYSACINTGPLSKLFELRRSKLVRKMDEKA